jgi:chromosome segregation ATPase
MSDEPRPDEEGRLLRFIASTVELTKDRLDTLSGRVDSLSERVDSLHDSLSERVDSLSEKVDSLSEKVDSLSERVDSLSGRVDSLSTWVATKDELRAQTTAIRGDIEQVQLRLDSIERALAARMGQIEADLSRLRSAVYLLSKERPEILRLLGQ